MRYIAMTRRITLIRGAKVVFEDCTASADLIVEDERIAGIVRHGGFVPTPDEVINAQNKVVMPGGIDPHVHVWEPGTPEWEGFEAASKGAAAGGITTFIEMPISRPATVDLRSFALKRRLAEASCVVDFALWGGLLPGKLENIVSLAEAGAVGFKAFMNKPRTEYYDNLPDGLLLQAMRQLSEIGSLIAIHCENEQILMHYRELLLKARRCDYLSHADWRPLICELEAIQRALLFASDVGVRLHIVHLSSARGAEMIQNAKASGQSVTVETCPHYLLMDIDDLARLGPYANCDPPLRPSPNKDLLWEYVRNGTIDLFASDHAPSTLEEKEKGLEDMWRAPMGIAGIQTMLPLLLDEAVNRRGLSLHLFAQLTATAPARIFGLYPRKGAIRVGADADLVIWDLDATWQVERGLLFTRHKWSPYEGMMCNARVVRTLVRGRTVYADGSILVGPGYGRMVRGRCGEDG